MATKPVIVSVDDDPEVLNAIERDLRRHFKGQSYADTEAAISSINEVGLDFVKAASGREGLEAARELKKRGAPVALYQWVDIDSDPAMRELVTSLTGDVLKLPVILLEDGTQLIAPTRSELANRCGLHTRASRPFYDMVIVGAGPAGLAAGVTGADLALRAATQAKRFGAEIVEAQEATSVRIEDPYRILTFADGSEVSCHSLVLAMGVAVRQLELPSAAPRHGIGIYYGAALTEAATYRGKDVCVVGAGNSAGQGALFFSRTARTVTVLARRDSLSYSMSQYLIDRLEETSNVRIVTEVEVTDVAGDQCLDKVVLRSTGTGETSSLEVAAMFVFIGASPHTELVADQVARDEKGFILTGPALHEDGQRPRGWTPDRDPFLFETSVPGIFAAGDVRAGSSKRVAAAVGEGSGTVGNVHAYLGTV